MADRRALGLIVDLRANEGGNDCGDEIIARLIDAPFSPEAEERRVRYKKTPEALNAFLETWDDGFRDWGERAIPREDGFYSLAADGDRDRQIAPKGPKFVGEVAVLIGPQNSSATFRFASLMRAHRLGTLIGETTGGNQRGINGGAFFFLRLPASGLEVDVPIIGYYPKRPDVPDGGLAPDIEAPWTAEAILEGRDPAMEAALNHIKA
jgi:C-terminal processing protease CtpA/Prc